MTYVCEIYCILLKMLEKSHKTIHIKKKLNGYIYVCYHFCRINILSIVNTI